MRNARAVMRALRIAVVREWILILLIVFWGLRVNKTKNVTCTKDYFDVNNIHLFTKGEVYKLGGTSITTNVENRSFMFYSEKDDFLNKHFIPGNIVKEDDPIDTLIQQSEKYWCNTGKEPLSKYHKKYTSAKTGDSAELDVYDLLDTLDLPNAEIEHTFKKLIRNGSGDKSRLQDMEEAYIQLGMGIKRMKNKTL